METNVGVLDGAARMLAGALLLAWSYGEIGQTPPGPISEAAWWLGAALAFTGLFHHCFIYSIFGVTSCAYGPDPDDKPGPPPRRSKTGSP